MNFDQAFSLLMKQCSKCLETKPTFEFHAQSSSKDGRHPWCKPCNKASVAKWRAADPARAAETAAKWRKNNPERAKMLDAKRYARDAERQRMLAARRRDPGKNRLNAARWRAEDPERAKLADATWRAKNPDKCRAKKAARRAAKMQAVPKWASELDQLAAVEAADLCKRREAVTGVPWHVDHIVPLRSKLVCGLHVAANFAVIPASINNRKGNRVWPDMP